MLGAELSLAAHLADISDELRALAERSPIHRRTAAASPTGSRCPSSMRGSPQPHQGSRWKPPGGRSVRPPLTRASKELQADLDVLDRSLIANNSRVIARGRLRLLRRAVDCFGFHLARLDIRQNSAVHERTVAELIDAAMPGMSYLALSEEARIALLFERAAQRAATDVQFRQVQRGDGRRTRACFMPPPKRTASSAPTAFPNASSPCARGCRTCWRSRCSQGGRPRRPLRPLRDQYRAAVRDHRGSAGLERHHGPHAVAARLSQAGG